ncbi:Ras-related protein RABA5c [Capsicum annuum]|nr:Ras-related protein RABA5c [Capsicum annuum]
MLVGNKCDLENIRAVSIEEGKSLAESEGMFFMETSALDSTNVNQAFEIVIREIYNSVSRKVLNSDSYKAELSVNRVSLVNDEMVGVVEIDNSDWLAVFVVDGGCDGGDGGWWLTMVAVAEVFSGQFGGCSPWFSELARGLVLYQAKIDRPPDGLWSGSRWFGGVGGAILVVKRAKRYERTIFGPIRWVLAHGSRGGPGVRCRIWEKIDRQPSDGLWSSSGWSGGIDGAILVVKRMKQHELTVFGSIWWVLAHSSRGAPEARCWVKIDR